MIDDAFECLDFYFDLGTPGHLRYTYPGAGVLISLA